VPDALGKDLSMTYIEILENVLCTVVVLSRMEKLSKLQEALLSNYWP
jgi:hypothetical protein